MKEKKKLGGFDECQAPAMDAEFMRINEIVRIFGVGRSTLYRLIRNGSIASVSLRLEGAKRGTRLVSVESMRRMLNGLAEGGDRA